MEQELLRRAEDLADRCERACILTGTAFLTPAEQASLSAWARSRPDVPLLLRGGCPDCERRAAFFLPDYLSEADFPDEEHFRALRITAGFGQPGHRDYLGAILALGIRRDFLGDLYVEDDRATLLCLPSVATHLLGSLDHVGRYGVRTEAIPLDAVHPPARRTKAVSFTVQSLRLDAAAAGLFRLSRATAADLIRAGAVTLNYLPCEKVDAPVRPGDIISIRGHGKAALTEAGGESRKGRIFLRGELYL